MAARRASGEAGAGTTVRVERIADQDHAGAVVVPPASRRMGERQGGGVARRVEPAGAEQHLRRVVAGRADARRARDSAWPSTMFSHWRQGIAARGSSAGQCGLPIGLSMSTSPCSTAAPTRAWVIDFAIDHEGSGVSGPKPSA